MIQVEPAALCLTGRCLPITEVVTMSYRAWFQCINPQCRAEYPLNSIIYRCKTCGSLLEVQHDLEALAKRDAKTWMKLFEDRYKSTEWPYGSGVWGKKEWILPQIDNENIVSLYEGGTNLFWAERFGKILGIENLCLTCDTSTVIPRSLNEPLWELPQSFTQRSSNPIIFPNRSAQNRLVLPS